jgi:hypothetical protein
MNLLLHGIEAPQIDPLNALRVRMSEIGDRDRVDVIITNPPFGGEEEKGIQRNFPNDRQTSETALLFLQLIMRKLRRAGHNGSTAGALALSYRTAPCRAMAWPPGSRLTSSTVQPAGVRLLRAKACSVAAAVGATSAIGISKALVRPYGAEQSQGDALGELLVVAGSAGERDQRDQPDDRA